MNNSKRIAKYVGTLFIIGTVAGILSVVFTGPILGSTDLLFGVTFSISLMPLALQEMYMAVWLIVKGFNPSAIVSESEEKKTFNRQYLL